MRNSIEISVHFKFIKKNTILLSLKLNKIMNYRLISIINKSCIFSYVSKAPNTIENSSRETPTIRASTLNVPKIFMETYHGHTKAIKNDDSLTLILNMASAWISQGRNLRINVANREKHVKGRSFVSRTTF